MTEFFFQQKSLNIDVRRLQPPTLETAWTEHLLITPIKPSNVFPHSAMPTRYASARLQSSRLQCLFFRPSQTLIIVRLYTQGHQGSILQTTIPRINTSGHGKRPWTLRGTMPKVIGRVYAQVNETSWKNSRMTLCTSFQCFFG